MTSFNTRATTIVLLLITLAAIAHAHPDGSDHFANMDYNFFANVGCQFEVLANHQLAQMTTSPMPGRSSALPRRRSQPHPRSQPTPSQVMMNEYFPPCGIEYNQLEQRGLSANSRSVSGPAGTSMYGQERGRANSELTWSQVSYPAFSGIPLASAQSDYSNSFLESMTYDTPLVAMEQPPPPPSVMDGSLMQLFPELEQPADQVPRSIPITTYGSPPGVPAANIPQILDSDVTSNPNYQVSMVERESGLINNMRGWARRVQTMGDRSVSLTVDTNHLAPPEVSPLHRSPSSASSAGSSVRSPSRRSKSQMTLGELKCHYCDAAFGTQGDLTHHLRSHQSYSTRNHVCKHCSKRFQYKKDLNRHLPRHDPNRQRFYCPFKGCKYNAKGFGRQDHLDRHLNTQHTRVDSPQASRSPSTHA